MATTYDIGIFIPSPNGLPARQEIIGPGNNGILVSGIDKLAQKYVILLMTRKGSVPYAPKRGSNFIDMLRITGMFTEQDVFSSFAGAQLDLRPQLTPDTSKPLDEQFDKAVLNNIVIFPENLLLNVQIYSKAGNSTLVHLPLHFNLQR